MKGGRSADFPFTSVSPLCVTKANAAEGTHPLLVVLDASLASSTGMFAFHAASADKTIFLTGKDIGKYLHSTGAVVQTVDMSKLGTAPAPAKEPSAQSAEAAARVRTAEAAKIPDAELIGITVRKDGDFSEWYQQVLKKGDMLEYYDVSGCYILKPWSYTVWQAIQSEWCGMGGREGRTDGPFPASLL